MSRRRRAVKREILPDAKFGDVVISRFMNALMYDGKKSAAEGIVYGALDVMKKKGGAQTQTGFLGAVGFARCRAGFARRSSVRNWNFLFGPRAGRLGTEI